jgi:SanA protein
VKYLLVIALAVALIAGVSAAAIWGWIQWRYSAMIETNPTALAHTPVAIVFGAGISKSGSLTPILVDRMDSAIALYRAGIVRKLLVSGDNRFANYDEPGRMYDYAVSQDVPPRDVVRDFAGRRTYDTCYRAREIFGVDRAILVTQRFHLPRAIFTCRNLGVDAVGFGADRRVYLSRRFNQVREVPASIAAWLDVKLLHPSPVLGAQEDMGL